MTTTQTDKYDIRTIPCPKWCVYQDAEDESCISDQRLVELSLYPRQHYTGGGWAPEYAEVAGIYDRGTDQVRVDLDLGGVPKMQLTPAEARQVAAALVEVADELEAGK